MASFLARLEFDYLGYCVVKAALSACTECALPSLDLFCSPVAGSLLSPVIVLCSAYCLFSVGVSDLSSSGAAEIAVHLGLIW